MKLRTYVRTNKCQEVTSFNNLVQGLCVRACTCISLTNVFLIFVLRENLKYTLSRNNMNSQTCAGGDYETRERGDVIITVIIVRYKHVYKFLRQRLPTL